MLCATYNVISIVLEEMSISRVAPHMQEQEVIFVCMEVYQNQSSQTASEAT